MYRHVAASTIFPFHYVSCVTILPRARVVLKLKIGVCNMVYIGLLSFVYLLMTVLIDPIRYYNLLITRISVYGTLGLVSSRTISLKHVYLCSLCPYLRVTIKKLYRPICIVSPVKTTKHIPLCNYDACAIFSLDPLSLVIHSNFVRSLLTLLSL